VSGRIYLNSLGRTFLSHVTRVFQELEDVRVEVSEQGNPAFNKVRVSSSTIGLCAQLFTIYISQNPDSVFSFFTQTPDVILDQLQSGEIDFAILPKPIISPEIEWLPLLNETLALVVSAKHRLAERKSINLLDLENENFIVQRGAEEFDEELTRTFERLQFVPKVVFETNELEVAFHATDQGLGILLIPYFTATRFFKNSAFNFKYVPLRTSVVTRTIGIARLKGHYLTKQAKHFYNFTVQYLTKMNELQQQ
jgi:DNA-binding transcriptional LysR family regulator